jgi:hypothetical protein
MRGYDPLPRMVRSRRANLALNICAVCLIGEVGRSLGTLRKLADAGLVKPQSQSVEKFNLEEST